MTEFLRGQLFWLLPVNLIPLVLMGVDKYRAVNGLRRIPERVLLLWAVPGGAAGALLGMALFRHKIRKPKFALGLPLLLCAQLALARYLAGRLG